MFTLRPVSVHRNVAIDTLRGLACVLLVAYHVVGSSKDVGLRLPDEHLLRSFNDVLSFLRMPLFAFLSGVVYACRPPSRLPGRIILGKVRRLLIPMLLVGTLVAVLQANTAGANTAPVNWALLHIIPVAQFWFLESLFWIFAAVALLDARALLRTQARFAGVVLSAVLLFALNPLPLYLGLQGAAYLLPAFLLGVWARRFGYLYSAATLQSIAFAAATLSIVWIALHGGYSPDRDSLLSLTLGASSCILLYRAEFKHAWLARIGHYSFGIYLFHTIFSAATRIALQPLHPPLFVSVVLGIAAGLLAPIVLERALRRLPPVGYWVLGERPPAAAQWTKTGVVT